MNAHNHHATSPSLKLVLAVSADGFLAKGPDDDMKWTGSEDKFLFKLLTSSGHDRTLLAGRKTAEQLPRLKHRSVVPITRNQFYEGGMTLAAAARRWPDAWLIGGPELALEALRLGMVDRAYINWCPRPIGGGIPYEPFRQYLVADKLWITSRSPASHEGFGGYTSGLEVYWGLKRGA